MNKKREKTRSHKTNRSVTTRVSPKAKRNRKDPVTLPTPNQKITPEKRSFKNRDINTNLSMDSSTSSGPRYCFSTEIPEHYNETYIIAIPKDPNWLYVYWEFSEEAARLMGSGLEQSGSKLVLRLKDADVEETIEAIVPFQIDINELCDGQYMEIPENSRQLQIECGCFSENGGFIPIVQSDPVILPQSDTQCFDIFASDEEKNQTMFDSVNNPVNNFSTAAQLDLNNSQTCSSYSKHIQTSAGSIF
ncbi:MAG TPA: DUF4912 domain-containing protein [Chitinispirillaceae bacterium]|nr:DUF4912 domain-containing protein [Chitinispirillaceae bacterium]